MFNAEDHFHHQGLIAPDKYLVLKWPKSATLKQLRLIKQIVCMQLDWFIEAEQIKTYADDEYTSWQGSPTNGLAA